MRQTLKRLTKMTASYSIVTLLGPFFTIFLTPLYTHILTPADYGVVDITLTLSWLLTSFVLMSMDGALSAYFFDGDVVYQRNLVTTATFFVSIVGLIAGVALTMASEPLAIFLFKDASQHNLFYMLSVNAICVPVFFVLMASLRLQMEVKRVNIISVIGLFSTITGNIVLVLLLDMKATGIIAANMIVNIVVCAIALVMARQTLRGTFTITILRPLVWTGAGLLPSGISFVLLANIDRLMLTQFVSQTDVGLYAIANKLASMLWVSLGPAWNAWWPLALEMGHEANAPQQYARIFEYFMAISMWLALGIGLFAPQILLIFTRDIYVPAAPYAAILLMCVGPIGLASYLFQVGLYVQKCTARVSYAYLLAAISNILLNLWTMPRWGVWGAIMATVLSGLILAALLHWYSQKVLPIPYRWDRLTLLTIAYLGLLLPFLFVPAINILVLRIVAIGIFPFVIFATGIVTTADFQMGIQFLWQQFNSRLSGT